MRKILLVEDDKNLAFLLAAQLEDDGYVVDTEPQGQSALQKLRTNTYNLVILDWMLPDISGVEVCRRYRLAGGRLPVLMLTCKGLPDDKATALDAGADDYVVKPFHPTELSARLRALTRRPPELMRTTMEIGELNIDTKARRVYKQGAEIPLVAKEYGLLELLARYPNHSFTAESLLSRLWPGDTASSTETVRTHVKNLRRKIGDLDGSFIVTRRGLGYSLDRRGRLSPPPIDGSLDGAACQG